MSSGKYMLYQWDDFEKFSRVVQKSHISKTKALVFNYG